MDASQRAYAVALLPRLPPGAEKAIDLAPYVGADLAVMDRDAKRMRGERPYVFTNLKTGIGVDTLIEWIRHSLLFES